VTDHTPPGDDPDEQAGKQHSPPIWRGVLGVAVLTGVIAAGLWIAMQLTKGPTTAGELPTGSTATPYVEAFAAAHPPTPTQRPETVSTPLPARLSEPTNVPPTVEVSIPTLLPSSNGAADVATTGLSATPASASRQGAATVVVSKAAETVIGGSNERTAETAGATLTESRPTPKPTPGTNGVGHGVPIPVDGPITIDDPAAEQAVSDAYLNYFQVSGEALYNLDPSPLGTVAADDELDGLRKSIEQDRNQGRAVKTNVRHNFLVVKVQGDDAQIVDNYDDSSIFIDPTTKQPLPGQVAPASYEDAPVASVLYHLHRFDGVWKVTAGTSYTCTGSAAPECTGQTP
jgi:hypothetical protein